MKGPSGLIDAFTASEYPADGKMQTHSTVVPISRPLEK